MDNASFYDPGVHKLLIKAAEDNNYPWQTKEYVSGGTDAGTIQRTRAGIKVGAVSAAVRYIHSPSCVAAVKDFEAIYGIASEFLKTCGGMNNA
jgi:endoglucanase